MTPAEKAILDRWYHSFEGQDIDIPGKRNEERTLAKNIKKILQPPVIKKARFYYAAAAVIMLVAAGYLLFQPAKEHAVAAVAQHQQLTLPDGTKVWLNAESSLEYAKKMDGNTRLVTLTGEAFFDVAHDGTRPFIITAGDVKVTVLGTAFDVKAYQGKPVMVTVTRGKVRVEDSRRHVTLITPNQQAVASQDGLDKKEVKATLFDSWKDGGLDFTDESFEDIAMTLHRQFNINIDFKEEALKHLRFTAGFDKGTGAEKMLDILGWINGTSRVNSNDTIWITH